MKKKISLLLIILLSFILISCSYIDEIIDKDPSIKEDTIENIDEDGYFTSKEDVSLYIYTYEKLPNNFITKKEASKLGWESSEGNLWEVTDQKSIGGDRFGNREGNLPDKEGRQYFEADINYEGGYRGAERIVYSNDGLIYYTEDHYDTFTLLYGDE
ncbi:MAG: ribonuclease domain-containing protein [Tissierella sp.]|uniref:ribonuclease domain-containing protein n=1 Tax=Tissierella sp. TaxID=41274 RepID=UPI003F98D81B